MADSWYFSGPLTIETPENGVGLKIDKKDQNEPALLLDSSGPGWGSGMQLRNTAQGGKTYGIYSGFGSLHFTDSDKHVDRLLIDASGNVGIGTSSPTHPLHVKTDFGFLALDTNAVAQDAGIRLMEGGTIKWHIYNSASAKKLFIDRDGLRGSLTIDESGNVGIGTTDPTKGKLVVDGGRLAVNPRSLTTWPAGWEDGIHTWDLYGEGTVGAGKDGKVNAYLSRDGHGHFSGQLTVGGTLQMGAGIISKASGGTGNLEVEGNLLVRGNIGVDRIFMTHGPVDDTEAIHTLDSLGPYCAIMAVEPSTQGNALVWYWKDGQGNKHKAWDGGHNL